MDYRDAILRELSERECERVGRATIRSLQQLGEAEGACMSDTVWNDICLQVQGEEATHWGLYVDLARGCVAHMVKTLPSSIKRAIWLQTPDGSEWESGDDDARSPYSDDDIAEYVLNEFVLGKAADWSNPSIRARQDENCRARNEDR